MKKGKVPLTETDKPEKCELTNTNKRKEREKPENNPGLGVDNEEGGNAGFERGEGFDQKKKKKRQLGWVWFRTGELQKAIR